MCGTAWPAPCHLDSAGGQAKQAASEADRPSTCPALPTLQLMEEECPLPPPGACSPELRDFLAQCMRKDPFQRPTAEQLLRHPFVQQQGCVGARLAGRLYAAACFHRMC